ncbi:MAG: hypothetical protein GVY27_08975, partial [Deinococcus-Thermus bacterium]|nr:hypothetical protein [Deinococcota bacterium]
MTAERPTDRPDMAHDPKAESLRRVLRPLRLTRLGMAAERFARAFWPLWSVLFLLAAPLFFGLHESAPAEAIWAAGGLGLLAALAA